MSVKSRQKQASNSSDKLNSIRQEYTKTKKQSVKQTLAKARAKLQPHEIKDPETALLEFLIVTLSRATRGLLSKSDEQEVMDLLSEAFTEEEQEQIRTIKFPVFLSEFIAHLVKVRYETVITETFDTDSSTEDVNDVSIGNLEVSAEVE